MCMLVIQGLWVDRGEDLERPDVELPLDMRFDEFGRPLMAGAEAGGLDA